MSGTVSAPSPAQIAAANIAARNYISQNCPLDIQQIFSGVIANGGSSPGQVLNIVPRNVGLITGFLVRVDMDIVVPAGVTLARTPFGGMNLLSNINFLDLSNLTRINTTGWHIAMLNSVKGRGPIGAAFVTDTPLGFGNNEPQGIAIPATIPAGTTQRISMTYHVPMSYSHDDLRGAIFAQVVNASMSLNLTVNPNVVAAPGAATASQSVYAQSGAGAVAVQNTKFTVYQMYYDQLPIGSGGPVLPLQDLTTSYQLKQTALTGLAAGQDFPVPYTNFNDFLSTMLVFDNGGSLNPATDVNYFALTTANASNLWKVEPWVNAWRTRSMLGVDMPPGTYYFESRKRPISTITYGNIQLVVNPSLVNPNAQLLTGFEYFTKQGVINATGSLPAG